MHLGHDVDTIDDNALGLGRAQGSVQHGALFRHVDPLTAEHRGHALTQTAFPGQSHEQSDRFIGDAVLRVVEVNTGGFGAQARAPARIFGEELPQMQITDRCAMCFERLPRRALCQR
jgi:hypothetical protein